MKKCNYYEPVSVDEALGLLSIFQEKCKPIAGGTDLVLSFRQSAVPPAHLVSLSAIIGLDEISHNTVMHIGSTTLMDSIDISPVLREYYCALSESASCVGSRQTRNLATIGGNICSAVPSADSAPSLLVFDALVVARSKDRERLIKIAEFFKGPKQTVLQCDELVLEFILPLPSPHTGSIYRRFTPRRALDLAMVGVAISLSLAEDLATISSARIALGAVAPIPFRSYNAESALMGNRLSDELVNEVADLAVESSSPISDVRGSADYRKEITRIMVKRCLQEAAKRAAHSSDMRGVL
jgi:CO/xanthine dehydrogenase FAD-binding subunit